MPGLLVFALLAAASFAMTTPSGRLRAARAERRGVEQGPGIRDGPLLLDLLAALLSAGASVEHALALVAGSCEPGIRSQLARVHTARLLGASWEAAWEAGAGSREDTPSPGFLRQVGRRSVRDRDRTVEDVRRGLRFATSTGAPSAALLHAHAAQLRRRYNREIDRKAAALGVQLVLPLGLCSLPAFICLGVVPVVLGLLPSLR